MHCLGEVPSLVHTPINTLSIVLILGSLRPVQCLLTLINNDLFPFDDKTKPDTAFCFCRNHEMKADAKHCRNGIGSSILVRVEKQAKQLHEKKRSRFQTHLLNLLLCFIVCFNILLPFLIKS